MTGVQESLPEGTGLEGLALEFEPADCPPSKRKRMCTLDMAILARDAVGQATGGAQLYRGDNNMLSVRALSPEELAEIPARIPDPL